MEHLSYAYIEATSQAYDWSKGYGDKWDIERPTLDHLSARDLVALGKDNGFNKGTEYEDIESLKTAIIEADMDNGRFDPMMNYFIELDNDYSNNNIADLFYGSCFTVIRIEEVDVIGLALTGGGMDMRWQMARAFIHAGYYPPSFVCDLPAMSGEHDKITIDACNKTLKALANRHLRAIERNNTLLKG